MFRACSTPPTTARPEGGGRKGGVGRAQRAKAREHGTGWAHPRRRLTRLSAETDGGAALRDVTLTLDAASRITELADQRANVTPAASLTSSFGYDDRYRLTSATDRVATTTWQYDSVSNIVAVESGHDAPGLNVTNTFGESGAGPDQMTHFGDEALRYDAGGRVTKDGTRTLTWDAQGRLVKVLRGDTTEEYVYDHTERRALKRTTSAGATETVKYIARDAEERCCLSRLSDGVRIQMNPPRNHAASRSGVATPGGSEPAWQSAQARARWDSRRRSRATRFASRRWSAMPPLARALSGERPAEALASATRHADDPLRAMSPDLDLDLVGSEHTPAVELDPRDWLPWGAPRGTWRPWWSWAHERAQRTRARARNHPAGHAESAGRQQSATAPREGTPCRASQRRAGIRQVPARPQRSEDERPPPAAPELGATRIWSVTSTHEAPWLNVENDFGEDGAGPDQMTHFGDEAISYDEGGRVTEDGERVLTWDAKGRLTKVERGDTTEEYVYDYSDTRALKRTTSGGNTEVVRYIDRDAEERDGELVRYVFFADQRLARLDALSGESQGALDPGVVPAAPTGWTPPPLGEAWRLLPLWLGLLGAMVAVAWGRRVVAFGRHLSDMLRAHPLRGPPRVGDTRVWRWGAVFAVVAAMAPGCKCGGDSAKSNAKPITELPADAVLYLADFQGSPLVTTNAVGGVTRETAYHPYGSVRSERGDEAEPWQFVGNEADTGSGLGDFRARPYRAEAGVFLAADPVAVFEGESVAATPGRLAAYGYGGGDPIGQVDRDGRIYWNVVIPIVVGAVFAYEYANAPGPEDQTKHLGGGGVALQTAANAIEIMSAGRFAQAAVSVASSTISRVAARRAAAGNVGRASGEVPAEAAGGGAPTRAGYNGVEGPAQVTPRTNRAGDTAVRVEFPDKTVMDVSPKRVKEFVPNSHPKAPPGTMQKVPFENAQPGSKGFKRDPTPSDLEWLK